MWIQGILMFKCKFVSLKLEINLIQFQILTVASEIGTTIARAWLHSWYLLIFFVLLAIWKILGGCVLPNAKRNQWEPNEIYRWCRWMSKSNKMTPIFVYSLVTYIFVRFVWVSTWWQRTPCENPLAEKRWTHSFLWLIGSLNSKDSAIGFIFVVYVFIQAHSLRIFLLPVIQFIQFGGDFFSWSFKGLLNIRTCSYPV